MQRKEYRLVLLGNWAQVLAAILLCWLGAGVWFVLLPLQIHFNQLNRKTADSIHSLLFLCASNVAATALAHMLAYHLYYLLVSSDELSLAIGQMGMAAGVFIVLVMSIVTVAMERRTGNL